LDYVIRKGTATDDGFVARAWVDTVRGSARQFRAVDSGHFNRFHYKAAGELIKRCEVRVAAPPGDDVTIYGVAVLEPSSTLVHLVYVRKNLRRLGIAKRLLEGVDVPECCFTTWSQDAVWLLEKYPHMRHVPYWMGMESDDG
jgi:GNAT superfamily N-acetyltransferase